MSYLRHVLHQVRFAVAGIGDESEACPGHSSSPAPTTDSGARCEDQVSREQRSVKLLIHCSVHQLLGPGGDLVLARQGAHGLPPQLRPVPGPAARSLHHLLQPVSDEK